MSKGTKDIKKNEKNQSKKEANKVNDNLYNHSSKDYLFNMSLAPGIKESTHWFQMLVAAFFTAVIIMITRMHTYQRPMEQFFWSGGDNNLTDFFSYYKMVAILVCAILALVLLLYRVFTQSFYIKRSFAYIPMIVYSILVLLSYILSDYNLFALWGWNDRFEGTLTLLSYMVLLFFIINSVNSEKNVKWIIYPLAVTSTLLGLLGITQALDHDFFRTAIGKKLITPSWFWDQVDNLNFTFQNREIYQTVYNINYVSFYLTLLIPLFGLLFIRSLMLGKEEPVWKKVLWAALFTLQVFNLIGSASSGGLMGMAVVVIAAIIVLNKKILNWWKPVAMLLILTVIVAGLSYERWVPELTGAINSVLGRQVVQDTKEEGISQEIEEVTSSGITESADERHTIDYMVTSGDAIEISFNGNEIIFTTYPEDPTALKVNDSSGERLSIVPTNISPIYKVDDERFNRITVRPAQDDSGNNYIVIGTDGNEWPFQLTEEGPKYFTGLGKLMDLRRVPSIGWENNLEFGSGRGYIWSRTIPMLKETLILGHGADTFCIYFPHDDYVGKYNSGTFSNEINIVVDKPHNMYFGAIIGTGGISMLALLALWGIYIIQSYLIYKKERYHSFVSYVGAGIFLGICGFLVSGLVNDSTVSVMPMFYGLLGTGIAINMMLNKRNASVE
ncbi:O-antigen ligase family protein [Sinanaerobacter chloroacetimidivorans]|uniref:O-antigen ligase family protein n=1 Tax=Sinanaerobacter chloroacetimidivorans TaxID=2818044 RepID=A0A8J8B4P3_9FIRM|nr:O-antigen ligase family protein [Sinanaerobacter chloroacetimidivorans]MBR0599545.1 O-antigen ligase family protein [Sinanaerobacter chloroacetimidivorans]